MNTQEQVQREIAPFDEQWEKIESYIRWDIIFTTMKALNWTWRMGNDNYGIPDIKTIKAHAMKLCSEAYEAGKGRRSTGGFTAGFDEGYLWLTFQVEEAHTAEL